MNRHEEYHVTVHGDPVDFVAHLAHIRRNLRPEFHIKPLWIELNTFDRQLMTASNFDPTHDLEAMRYRILRVKREMYVPPGKVLIFSEAPPLTTFLHVGPPRYVVHPTKEACYYECHVKLDGKFRPDLILTSRDLYRESRWYFTKRENFPFDPEEFVRYVYRAVGTESTIAGVEYEACLSDTNRDLDAAWVKPATGWRP